jgi:flavin-dependent dehydrogenase
VLLVERRMADAGGAQWHNGVLDRHFVRAGLEPPAGLERGTDGGRVHLRAQDPTIGPTLHDAPTVAADMSLLGQRLRKLATGAGTELIDQVQDLAVGVDPDTGRLSTMTLRREGAQTPVTVAAGLFVDASGRRGVLRRHARDLEAWCPPVERDELCSASDVHHAVDDARGAEHFLERHGACAGDSVTYVGLSGGFSTCAITISADLSTVGVVVGCLANGRYSTGPAMVAALCEREPWIGAAIVTGSGIIPLRRPFARITAPGLALVGDAACQVFPAHGSGIGAGLVAGTVLAEGVADADDPGDPHRLWSGYQTAYQREVGRDLLSYDALRRTTTRLGSTGVDALVRSGLMDEHTTRTGLEQRWASPPPAVAARSALLLARNPRLAAVMVPALVRAQLLHAHGSRYPEQLDLDALARWDRRTEQLLGSLPH